MGFFNKNMFSNGAVNNGDYPNVDYYSELPDPALWSGKYYMVTYNSGIWLINRHPAGFYKSNGTAWIYVDNMPETTSLSDGTTNITGVNVKLVGANGIKTITDVPNNQILFDGEELIQQAIDLAIAFGD